MFVISGLNILRTYSRYMPLIANKRGKMLKVTYFRDRKTGTIKNYYVYEEKDHPNVNWQQRVDEYNNGNFSDECFLVDIQDNSFEKYLIDLNKCYRADITESIENVLNELDEVRDALERML